jgi:hypothetical protein
MAGELEPKVFGQKTCTDPIIVGQPSYNYDWVLKPSNNDVGHTSRYCSSTRMCPILLLII